MQWVYVIAGVVLFMLVISVGACIAHYSAVTSLCAGPAPAGDGNLECPSLSSKPIATTPNSLGPSMQPVDTVYDATRLVKPSDSTPIGPTAGRNMKLMMSTEL